MIVLQTAHAHAGLLVLRGQAQARRRRRRVIGAVLAGALAALAWRVILAPAPAVARAPEPERLEPANAPQPSMPAMDDVVPRPALEAA